MPEYILTSLNMAEHGSILLNVPLPLNMPEYVLINCSDYANVLNIPLQYSYNNIIIIVTNVNILELLSARFVHPGCLLPFYLLLT